MSIITYLLIIIIIIIIISLADRLIEFLFAGGSLIQFLCAPPIDVARVGTRQKNVAASAARRRGCVTSSTSSGYSTRGALADRLWCSVRRKDVRRTGEVVAGEMW